ncbi:MAG: alpha/beta hydrolase [Polyangiaceae bacterium]
MRINGCELYVQDTGRGVPVVFSHGLLWSARMYAAQINALAGRYRCIAYDHRGQGRSESPRGDILSGHGISIEQVYLDAVALLEALELGPCHFVGLSMGGFVGQRIAARRPDLLRSLVLLETAADPEPKANLPKYTALNTVARYGGLGLLAGQVMPIMFGDSFLQDPERKQLRAHWTRQLKSNRRSIYKAVNGVISREDFSQDLSKIEVPTLIVHGAEDRAIVRERAERLHAGIAGSEFVLLPRGGHTSTVEEPELINAELERFLAAH